MITQLVGRALAEKYIILDKIRENYRLQNSDWVIKKRETF